MPDETDSELLERARAGRRDALEALLERFQPQVYRFGLKMCRNPQDAEDVLQETLLAAARGLGDFRGASSLSTWLFTIARSFCIKKRRKSKFAPREERSLDVEPSATQLADSAPAPDDALSGKQVERVTEEAIAALPPLHREVLLLRDVEGLPAAEVASVLGISVQAVKSRLHRARLAVRARVAPALGIFIEPAVAPQTCPDVLALFSRHLEDEISPETCAQMERHIEHCAHCRGTCDSLKRTLALCRTTAPHVTVPAQVQASVKLALHNLLVEGS
jgi:RNA polymerase sigma-70 factor (ECF subfamily)